MIELLLRTVGIEKDKPMPPEVQQLIDEQTERLAEIVAAKVVERLQAAPTLTE
jgi:hypothetical protein